MRRTTSAVQPVWWLAPNPRLVSPEKYSWNSKSSRQCGSRASVRRSPSGDLSRRVHGCRPDGISQRQISGIRRHSQHAIGDISVCPASLRVGEAKGTTRTGRAERAAVGWASSRFGSSGVLVSAAFLGLSDVDALTYSMAKLGGGPMGPSIAARGLAVDILSNTAFKLALAVSLGRGVFRQLAGAGLAALAVAGLGMVLLH